MPVTPIRNTVRFPHDAIATPCHKVSGPQSYGEVAPRTGVGLLGIAFANRLHRVHLTTFRFGTAVPGPQSFHIQWFTLITAPITPGHDLVPPTLFRMLPGATG